MSIHIPHNMQIISSKFYQLLSNYNNRASGGSVSRVFGELLSGGVGAMDRAHLNTQLYLSLINTSMFRHGKE